MKSFGNLSMQTFLTRFADMYGFELSGFKDNGRMEYGYQISGTRLKIRLFYNMETWKITVIGNNDYIQETDKCHEIWAEVDDDDRLVFHMSTRLSPALTSGHIMYVKKSCDRLIIPLGVI